MRRLGDCPVLLAREGVEPPLQDACSVTPGDGDGRVGAEGVDDQDLIGEAHRLEAGRDVGLFVVSRDQDRQRPAAPHALRVARPGSAPPHCLRASRSCFSAFL